MKSMFKLMAITLILSISGSMFAALNQTPQTEQDLKDIAHDKDVVAKASAPVEPTTKSYDVTAKTMQQELAAERETAPIVKETKKEVIEVKQTIPASTSPSSMEFPEMTEEERKEFEKLMAELTPEQRVELEQLVKELEQAYEKEKAKQGGSVAMPSSAVPSSEQTWSEWFWSFFGY